MPDFATKKLPLNEIRKDDFRWEKEEQNTFENIKNELYVSLSVQLSATVTTDASEKKIGGDFLQ